MVEIRNVAASRRDASESVVLQAEKPSSLSFGVIHREVRIAFGGEGKRVRTRVSARGEQASQMFPDAGTIEHVVQGFADLKHGEITIQSVSFAIGPPDE